MVMPWNKHSSTWEVPWEDRWENRKSVTVRMSDGITKTIKGNPAKITEGTVLGYSDDIKAELSGAGICLGFWTLVLFGFSFII